MKGGAATAVEVSKLESQLSSERASHEELAGKMIQLQTESDALRTSNAQQTAHIVELEAALAGRGDGGEGGGDRPGIPASATEEMSVLRRRHQEAVAENSAFERRVAALAAEVRM